MDDVYQIIVLKCDINSIKCLYLVDKRFNNVINDTYTLLQLGDKFNVYKHNNFKDIVNKCGMLCIPQKSKHKPINKKKFNYKLYRTRYNDDMPFLVKIIKNVVYIHKPGEWDLECSCDECSCEDEEDCGCGCCDHDSYEEEEKYYKRNYKYKFKPKDIFIGKDPFNNHKNYNEFTFYNPNTTNDSMFFKRKKCICCCKNNHCNNDKICTCGGCDKCHWHVKHGYLYNKNRSEFNGSNILLHMDKLEYIYIDKEVYKFEALGKIVNFIAVEGENNKVYAYGVDEYNNIYLFLDKVIMKMNKDIMKVLNTNDDMYHNNVYYYYYNMLSYNDRTDTNIIIPFVTEPIKQ